MHRYSSAGFFDTTVNPHVTVRFAKALCAKGGHVTFVSFRVSHIFVARDAAPAAIKWMDDCFQACPRPRAAIRPRP